MSRLFQICCRAVAFASLALSASGCFTYHYKNTSVPPGEEHEDWASFFVFGIAGHHEVDTRDFCPGEVSKIEVGTNGLTWLVSTLTIGVYTPRKVVITCAAGPAGPVAAYEIELDRRGAPAHLVRRVGDRAWAGRARALGAERYAVRLEEVGQ
jgi:hypothetical protein